MHNRLFTRLNAREEAALSEETLVNYAQELGLETRSFSECLSSQRYFDEVLLDYQVAQAYGLRGTPGFVINGVVYTIGAQPFDVFDQIIQSELARVTGES
jgi:predicted DsbA family dithiol-disulfide isomerase